MSCFPSGWSALDTGLSNIVLVSRLLALMVQVHFAAIVLPAPGGLWVDGGLVVNRWTVACELVDRGRKTVDSGLGDVGRWTGGGQWMLYCERWMVVQSGSQISSQGMQITLS